MRRPTDPNSVGRGRQVSVAGNILGHEMIRIPGISAAELAQVLPTIYFELVTNTLEPFRLALFPEDYIRSVDEESFISIGTRLRGRGTMATNVLRHVAIHIDSRNRRIGFADPVDAI